MNTKLKSFFLKRLRHEDQIRHRNKVPDRILRRMGFHSECQGLIDRYIQVEGAWDDHLFRTRSFISDAIAGKEFDNLVVLGSGWMLDLPIESLTAVSNRVWLYDVVHPLQVIHKLRKYGNVMAISADITGGCIVNAWQAVKQYKRTGVKASPESICSAVFQAEMMPDYVISLNLLSQIGVMITGYLQRYIPYSPEEIQMINRLLQQAHLDLLKPGKSCLVTDYREMNVDVSAGPEESSELIQVLLSDKPDAQTWEWNFDPNGGYKAGKKTILQVLAMEL